MQLKKYIFLIFLLVVSYNVHATMQRPEEIIYEGKTYPLFINPLEEYFSKYPDRRPEVDSCVLRLDGIREVKRPCFRSSALWRGYIATFEIVDGELLLNDIVILTIGGGRSVLPEFLDKQSPEWFNKKVETKFKIKWFNGYITIPQGKEENYIVLKIKNGKLIREYKLDDFRIYNFIELM